MPAPPGLVRRSAPRPRRRTRGPRKSARSTRPIGPSSMTVPTTRSCGARPTRNSTLPTPEARITSAVYATGKLAVAHAQNRVRLVDRCGDRPDIGAACAATRERAASALGDKVGDARDLIRHHEEDKDRRERCDSTAQREPNGSSSEHHGDHTSQPRASRARDDNPDGRQQGDETAQDAVIAVQHLVQAEDKGGCKDRGILRWVLTLDGHGTRASQALCEVDLKRRSRRLPPRKDCRSRGRVG